MSMRFHPRGPPAVCEERHPEPRLVSQINPVSGTVSRSSAPDVTTVKDGLEASGTD